MVFIFSYDREDMLNNVLECIEEADRVWILDDGSKFDHPHPGFIKFKHGGKQRFWEKWQTALRIAEGSNDDFFLFTPDDFTDLKLDSIHKLHMTMGKAPYAYNTINDGRDRCWNGKASKPYNSIARQVFFVDCGFFCNRAALEAIKWHIAPVHGRRFMKGMPISSGVGQQLTYAFNASGVTMLQPIRSLAKHGAHESKMHPGHRGKVKLLSK